MKKIVVKHLNVGDVEDPEIYLGAVAFDWLKTDHGAWVNEHAQDMIYHRHIDSNTYGYKYAIHAVFNEEDALIYQLKWSTV
jgi:hypothetical protein